MDCKDIKSDPEAASPDPSGHGFEQPGLEAAEHSGLEVVQPRELLSLNKTWEKASPLPEASPATAVGGGPPEYPSPSAFPDPSEQHLGACDHDHSQAGLIPHAPDGRPDEQRPQTICGVRRKIFWPILAVATLAVVVAVAVGAGVGVSMHKTPTPTSILPQANGAITLPAATAKATTSAELAIACPSDNLTLYTSGVSTSKSYLLLCGRDYNSAQGAIDLYNNKTKTMDACIDLCAQQVGCVGAGWGFYNGSMICWLKSELGDFNSSPAWYFAIEDDDGSNKHVVST